MDQILSSDHCHTMIHIKTSPYKNGIKHWFWHKKRGMVIGKTGLMKPYPKLHFIQNCLEATEKEDRQEIQIGDTCCIKFKEYENAIFVFVVGFDGNGFIFQNKEKQILSNLNIEFHEVISNNTNEISLPIERNLVKAEIKEELDFLEKIDYQCAADELLQHVYDPAYSISKETFVKIHKMIFNKIYDWAGKIRYKEDDELVIGYKQYPTMHPLQVGNSLDELFDEIGEFNTKDVVSKKELVLLLAKVHTRLAWIHPFKDGNGRTIRLFCQFIALKFDYLLHIENITKKKRCYYTYAVRSSVNNKKGPLSTLISNNLEEVFN